MIAWIVDILTHSRPSVIFFYSPQEIDEQIVTTFESHLQGLHEQFKIFFRARHKVLMDQKSICRHQSS